MLETLIAFSSTDDIDMYSDYANNPAASGYGIITGLLLIIGMWLVFRKAGRHGWAAIIPIYGTYTLVKVAERPGWWTIMFYIPLVGIVFHIIVSLDVSKRFGHGGAFGFFLLAVFGWLGYAILGFGKSEYRSLPHS